MLSFFKHFERKNELLQKRWVFTEGPPEALQAETLNAMSDAQLLERASETRRELSDKVLIAENIVRRLTELKDEEKEAPLISPLKNLLAEIDASTDAEIKAEGTRLRDRAKVAVENIMQKGLLFLPSVASIASAFNTLRTDISKFDLSDLATGGWEKITKSFGDLMYYIKDLMPESLKKYLKAFIPNEAPVTTPETPTKPPETPDKAPEGYDENEGEKLKKFSSIEIVEPQPAEDTENIYFKFQDNGPEWRMKPDGSGPEVKIGANEWSVGDSTNVVATYLSSHKDTINNLFESQSPIPPPAPLQKRNLAKTLITLQKAESAKAFPRDVTTLISGKWQSFYEANKSTYGNKEALLNALNTNPAKILQEISAMRVTPPPAQETAPVEEPASAETEPEVQPEPATEPESTAVEQTTTAQPEPEQTAEPEEVKF